MTNKLKYLLKKTALYAVSLFLFCAFIWASVFAYYVHILKTYDHKEPLKKADAIIVLTGDRHRIAYGINLMNKGLSPVTFISGAHNDFNDENLIENNPCCIEVGFEARDTIGNALEAGRWLHAKNYKTFLLVTSDYHMPRAANIFNRILGDDISFQTAIVKKDTKKITSRRVKLIAKEFHKYVIQKVIPLQFLKK